MVDVFNGRLCLPALPFVFVTAAVVIMILPGPAVSFAQPPSTAQLTLSYSVVGGGLYLPPKVWFTANNGTLENETMSGTPTMYIAEPDTPWGVSKILSGGNATNSWERWENNPSIYSYGNTIGNTNGSQSMHFVYYRQIYATFGLPSAVKDTALLIPTVNYTAFGTGESVPADKSTWADYQSIYNYTTVATSTPGARWYFPSPAGTITGAFQIIPPYFLQYRLNMSLDTTGPVTLPSVSFTETFEGGRLNQTLYAPNGSFWADSNSHINFQSVVYPGSTNYRWALNSVSPTTAIAPSAVLVSYYEQYPLSITYSLSSGEAPSGPIVTATSDGAGASVELYPGAPPTWVDAGTQYSISQLLLGSTSAERWSAGAGIGGTAGGAATLNIEYFHQVLIGFSYSVAGGGSIPSANATFFGFGSQASVPMESSQQSIWADYGSTMTFPGSFAGSGTERWILGSNPSVAIVSPSTVLLVYYHQFDVQTGYNVTGGGNLQGPLVSGSNLGKPYSATITSGTSVWLDAEAPWGVPAFIAGPPGERWVDTTGANGTVSSSTVVDPTYQNEYFVTISADPQGSGTLTPGTWVMPGASITLAESPAKGWAFVAWRGVGQGSYSGEMGSPVLVVSGPMQETADFDAGIAILVKGSGSVVASIGPNSYTATGELTFFVPYGTNITLVAKPGFLNTFQGWQGIPAGQAGAVQFTVRTPLPATANFGVNKVAVFGLIVLLCGVGVYFVAYFTWNKRVSPRRLLETLHRQEDSVG